MYAKGEAVIQILEQLAPKHLALEEDRIGLQLGTLYKEVRQVMVALDVVDAVVEEAIALRTDLIIAHHAIIYRSLKHLRTDQPAGRLYEKLIKHDIAVYVAHTNLDIAAGGINDMLAHALGVEGLKPLEETGLGRVGQLPGVHQVADLVQLVKTKFALPCVRVVGDLRGTVRKIAILGGSGGRYIQQALFAGADVLITGDIDYHTAHDAQAAGLTIIDAGHNIEKIMKSQIADHLTQALTAKKSLTKVAASQIDTEVFKFV